MLFKLVYQLKRPKLALVFGEDKSRVAELSQKALGKKMKSCFWSVLFSEIVIIEADPRKDLEKIKFLAENSSLLISVLAGDLTVASIKKIEDLVSKSNQRRVLIGETRFNLKGDNVWTVGFEKKSDLVIGDLNVSQDTNFKIDNKGNVVPFWLNRKMTRKETVLVSLGVALAMAAGLNLVQISQNLQKDFFLLE
jgi:hypothetical protein